MGSEENENHYLVECLGNARHASHLALVVGPLDTYQSYASLNSP